MNFMMNPKTVLTVIAVLNALHGILWIFFLPLPEMGEEAALICTLTERLSVVSICSFF